MTSADHSSDDAPQSAALRVVAVVGPTGVGKSAVAEEVAIRCGGQIVSADSMQVYRGMDIGTAKTPPDQRRVPYHCIDIVAPGEPFSAALFQRCAREAFASTTADGALPVLVGGTGMYVRATLDPWEFPAGEQIGNTARDRYMALANDLGAEGLHLYLKERDARAAELIHPNNVRRVVRALEMLDEGVSYADQHAGFGNRTSIYDTRIFGLDMDRQALYAAIDRRVDAMIESGLLEEVAALLDAGFRSAVTAQHAIGYKELVPVVEGTAALEDAVEAIKQATRRYAKRQMTWFRRDPRIEWIDVTELTPDQAAGLIVTALD